MIASTSFVLYYSSLTSQTLNISEIIHTAASYLFSWGVGYISVFAPQGIGIFEIVAGKMLILPISIGGAIAFIAGFRIVSLAADSLTFMLYYFLKHSLPKKQP
jgi:hypothetical protein